MPQTRPSLETPPSAISTFPEFLFNILEKGLADRSGLALAVEHDLVENFMWANDYPHHEGTWPHSAAAIERTMGDLTDEQRAKILGTNAARFFGIEPPAAR